MKYLVNQQEEWVRHTKKQLCTPDCILTLIYNSVKLQLFGGYQYNHRIDLEYMRVSIMVLCHPASMLVQDQTQASS